MRLGVSKRVVLIALLLSSAACTAILGTYDTESTTGSNDAGASDAARTDGAPPLTDGGTPLANCTTWRYKNPIPVDDLSRLKSARNFQRVEVVPVLTGAAVSASTVRVLAGRQGAVGFSLYTIDFDAQTSQNFEAPLTSGIGNPLTSTTGSVQAIRQGSAGSIDNFAAVGSLVTTSSLATSDGGTGGTKSTTYVAWILHEQGLTADGGAIVGPFTVYAPEAGTQLDNLVVQPLTDTELFATVLTDQGTGTYSLIGGHAQASLPIVPNPIAMSNNVLDNGSAKVVETSTGTIGIFARQVETEETFEWSVPAAQDAFTVGAPRAVGAGTVLDVAQSLTPSNSYDVLYFRSAAAGLPEFENIYVGNYQANLDGLSTITDGGLQLALEFSDTAPNDAGDNATSQALNNILAPQWYRDQVAMIGKHVLPDGGPATGINFAWLDHLGQVRSTELGVNALLQDHSNFVWADAYPVVFTPGVTTATWDVAWVEEKTDDAGAAYEVLYANQLMCQ